MAWFHTLGEGVVRAGKQGKVCLFLQALVLCFVSLRQRGTGHTQTPCGVERYKQALEMGRCQLGQ